MRITSLVIVAALTLWSTTVRAEQLYVEDKLVLNVYAEASSSSARVASIETGDAVEALEHLDTFVRVQLADGREGWVGANYLSAQPPAIVRLKELERGAGSVASEPSTRLNDEIARLKRQNTTLQHELEALKKKPSVTPPTPVAATAAPAAHLDVEPLAAPPREPTIVIDRSYWWAWSLAVLAAAAAGFYAGYQTLGRRVRARFGGVKVY